MKHCNKLFTNTVFTSCLYLLFISILAIGTSGCQKSRTGKNPIYRVDIKAQPDFLSGEWLIEITDVSGECSNDPFPMENKTFLSLIQQEGDKISIQDLFGEEDLGAFDGINITYMLAGDDEGGSWTIEATLTMIDDNHFSGTVTETNNYSDEICTLTYKIKGIRQDSFMTGRWELTIDGSETCTGPDGSSDDNYNNKVTVDITQDETNNLTITYVSGDEIPELTGTVSGDSILLFVYPFKEEPDIIATVSADRDNFIGTDSYTDTGEDWSCEGQMTITGTRL